MYEVLFKRSDGSFIIRKGGFPYHVQEGDPIFDLMGDSDAVQNAPSEPAPPAPPEREIAEVSNFQARALLIERGLFDEVDAKLKAKGGKALAAWEYASVIYRNSNLVEEIAAELELTDSEIDEMFEAASQITA